MISRLSAMIIQSHPDSDLLIDAMQHRSNNLWAGWLYLLRDGEIHQPIFNSDPTYKTAKEARRVIEDAVCELRRLGDSIYSVVAEED